MNIATMITTRFYKWRDHMNKILSRHDFYFTVDEIYKQCASVQKLFFDNDEAFIVVNVVEYPRDRHIHLMLAGGTIEGLFKLEPILHNFAMQIGATKATVIVRKGFVKALKEHGWTAPFIYMEKEIL